MTAERRTDWIAALLAVVIVVVVLVVVYAVVWALCLGCAYQRCVESGNFMVKGIGCVTEGADGALRRVKP